MFSHDIYFRMFVIFRPSIHDYALAHDFEFEVIHKKFTIYYVHSGELRCARELHLLYDSFRVQSKKKK